MIQIAKNEIPHLKQIVEKRINTLLAEAIKCAKTRPEDAKEYIKLSRKLSMRHRIPLKKDRKKLFCKKCNSPLIKGFNLTITKDKEWEIYTCKCNHKAKFHL